MSLGELQELFVLKQAEWVIDLLDAHPNWKLRDGEGRILQMGPDGKKGRRVKKLGVTWYARDAVHIEGSAHYNGIGKDWNLFVDGVLITSTDHPAWVEAGTRWEELGRMMGRTDFVWGGRFTHPDGNHLSIRYNGKS